MSEWDEIRTDGTFLFRPIAHLIYERVGALIQWELILNPHVEKASAQQISTEH